MLNSAVDRRPVSRYARIVIAVVVFAGAVSLAAAQNIFGAFTGTVVDSSGAPVPDVTLVMSNNERQSKNEVRTSSFGTFEFVGLPQGNYQLEAKRAGFATLRENLAIKAGQRLERRLALELGSLEETIVVKDGPETSTKPRTRSVAVTAPPACTMLAVGGNIVAPRKIKDVGPVYPEALRGSGLEGLVVMDVMLGVDGHLKDIQVRQPADAQLAAAAVAAVQEWQYTQTLLNCAPVEVKMTVTTKFSTQ